MSIGKVIKFDSAFRPQFGITRGVLNFGQNIARFISYRQRNKRRCAVLFSLVALLILSYVAYAKYAGSSLSENGKMESAILKETMHFSVYLPPGYSVFENRNKKYPVLYLLHGATGDHTIYPRKIGMRKIADKAIRSGKTASMIIVIPRSRGGVYANIGRGTYSYEDYFFRELIPHIEKAYRVRTEKEHRAVAGHSMGGNGALLYGLKHPDLFASCCAVGAAIELKEPAETDTSWTHENNLIVLLQKAAEAQSNNSLNVRFYIDCGKEDGLCKVNEQLHHEMTKWGIPHEYHAGEGGHTWQYWREAMPGVLEFVNKTFPER